MATKWDYEGEYLKQFPRLAQGTVANYFCYAVRDGFKQVEAILSDVEYRAQRHKGRSPDNAVNDDVLNLVIASLENDEARRFAEFILWRESLSLAEKTKLKADSNTVYRNEYLSHQPATDKQKAYLCSLGCTVEPESKTHASQLIEQFKR